MKKLLKSAATFGFGLAAATLITKAIDLKTENDTSSKSKTTLEKPEIEKDVKIRPTVEKCVKGDGRVVFILKQSENAFNSYMKESIAHFGSDLTINPGQVHGVFRSIVFPEMWSHTGHEVLLSVTAEYHNDEGRGIEQITNLKLSPGTNVEDRTLTHADIQRFADEMSRGVMPKQISFKFHMQDHHAVYSLVDENFVFKDPFRFEFEGDANTRFIISMWAKYDSGDETEMIESVFRISK
ncbi:hypothetical protein G7062_00460 [Erysipelothrix sp. HDW6C]|uniref:hypothetical protein n=1 Tax=Erysipelothrix sp. HDW6C TaxID=2714930 RepID=UPI00140E2E75|nr:hypothetical protein [Erysipelothrix sp. HDW6C]QIK68847.1 hypothetical protein G7062_00460 [Erysipelothrix sp. HDW6C]